MKLSNRLIGALLVLLGVGVFAYGMTLPPMPGQRYGAGLFPMLLGICFVGFGFTLARSGGRNVEPLLRTEGWARDRRLIANMLLVLILIVVYVLLSERVGFFLMSLGILTILFRRFGVPLLKSVAVAVLATVFIQGAFASVLRVPLPRGLLEGVLW